MCTAISIDSGMFGRTLDLECSYGEGVIIKPRCFSLKGTNGERISGGHAIIGVGTVREGYPLYYDAMNEHGVYIAGLNFPFSARFHSPEKCNDKCRITVYELIPYVLSRVKSSREAINMLREAVIIEAPFNPNLASARLHWMVADTDHCAVIECEEHGMKIYDNTIGVLTNEPSFDFHLKNLSRYISLSPNEPHGSPFMGEVAQRRSNAVGGFGLPGDFTSESRFIRAAFISSSYVSKKKICAGDLFHILDSVAIARGVVRKDDGENIITVYTSVADANSLSYHYTTYDNRDVRRVSMGDFDVDQRDLFVIDLQ